MNQRCRAKNKETCWKHGTGLGFDANRLIRAELKNKPNEYNDHETFIQALKTYDSQHLASIIYNFAEQRNHISGEKIKSALLLASDLHKTDTRANRAQHDRTPYIEHPLRNTLRIIRYGCDDQDTIVGSLLHDTVEDHPWEIARDYAKQEPRDEHHAREIAFAYIEKKFGRGASEIVSGMSNPINEDKYMPAAEKNIIYRDHVVEAIRNPKVFIGKVSDFTDNGLSLHHTEAGMSPTSLYKKSTKYLLVIDPLISRLKEGYFKGDLPIREHGYRNIMKQLEEGKQNLLNINKRHSPAK